MVTTVPLSALLDVPAIRRYRLHICNVWCAIIGLSVLLVAFVSRFAGYAALMISCSAAAGPVRMYLQIMANCSNMNLKEIFQYSFISKGSSLVLRAPFGILEHDLQKISFLNFV